MTTYEAYYMLGKLDKQEGRECKHPPALPHPDAFRGYMAGYCGHVINEGKSPELIIDKLVEQGMTFVEDNLLAKGYK